MFPLEVVFRVDVFTLQSAEVNIMFHGLVVDKHRVRKAGLELVDDPVAF